MIDARLTLLTMEEGDFGGRLVFSEESTGSEEPTEEFETTQTDEEVFEVCSFFWAAETRNI